MNIIKASLPIVVLFHSVASSTDDAVAPISSHHIRINTNLSAAAKRKEMTSRKRMTNYVKEQQMFYITDSDKYQGPMLYETPPKDNGDATTNFYTEDEEAVTSSKSTMRYVKVFWFCAPTYAPDTNVDDTYDNVVARAITFSLAGYVEDDPAANPQGKWTTHGYTASYSNEAGTYSEVLSSFDDTTVFHFYGLSIQAYRTSHAGSKNGLVIAGKGEWTFHVNHPILQAIAYELGTELTEGSCMRKFGVSIMVFSPPHVPLGSNRVGSRM